MGVALDGREPALLVVLMSGLVAWMGILRDSSGTNDAGDTKVVWWEKPRRFRVSSDNKKALYVVGHCDREREAGQRTPGSE